MAEWLGAVERCLRLDYDLACEVARGAQLVKGYGDVRRRMVAAFRALLDSVLAAAAIDPGAARALAEECRTLVLRGPEGEDAASQTAGRTLERLRRSVAGSVLQRDRLPSD